MSQACQKYLVFCSNIRDGLHLAMNMKANQRLTSELGKEWVERTRELASGPTSGHAKECQTFQSEVGPASSSRIIITLYTPHGSQCQKRDVKKEMSMSGSE